MKKHRKSGLLTLLLTGMCAVAAVTGVALAPETTAHAAELGNRNSVDEFLIGGFMNFYDYNTTSRDDQIRDLARSGINWVDTTMVSTPNPTGHDAEWTDEEWIRVNEICEELKIYFSMTGNFSIMPMESAERYVKLAKENDFTRCIAYLVKDEPNMAQFPTVIEVARYLYEQDPTRFASINLYPNYAGATNLGGSYEDYVRTWVAQAGELVEYLWFDHYPFTGFDKTYRPSFFSDAETIRKVAWENNRLKTGGYTQMGWWNGMRRPTVDEARWSVNSLLTYGMKGLSHFCWVAPQFVPPPQGEGMRDFVLTSSGEKTDLYEPMQKVNWQTRQLGPILMSFDVAHAYHTGTVPTGTEALPRNFLLQPSSQSDELVISMCYSRDDSEKYVMLFNKELTGEKTYTFKADTSTGLTSLTWYKPDSFETLPDGTKPLPLPEEVPVTLEDGSFSVTLKAGEMRVYKLEGDVAVREPLSAPQISHRSGTYLGEQVVTLSSIDEGAQVYYTTDGSYPTYRSARYTAPIKVGNGRELGFYNIKAVAIRGDEVSDPATGDYIITDGAENVALGKPVTFTGETKVWTGSQNAASITDGNLDPFNVWGSRNNAPCFAVVDFGKEYTVDKVAAKAYHDWAFDDVVLQLSTSADFSTGVYTVFNNDTDNSVGVGAGTDGTWKETGFAMKHTFKFAPVSARYMRFHNLSVSEAGKRYSMWEEMQAYTAYDGGTELLSASSVADENKWIATGGGTWKWEEDALKQTGAEDRVSWDRSFTYRAKKYKNFILEGKFKMNTADPSAWGYVGFGMYKPSVGSVQSNYDQGFYAVIEPRGRVLLWNGAKPELGPEDANVAGFSLGSEFDLRVISVDDTISISVNGKPAMYVQDERLDREAGYISIHGGLIPVDVSSVRITELTDSQKPIDDAAKIKTAGETDIAVDRYTTKADVLKQLPATMTLTTSDGKSRTLPVTWDCEFFDPAKTGYTVFSGTFADLPDTVVNPDGLTATANVFIKPQLDFSEINALIARAHRADPKYFTKESYDAMKIKLDAAEVVVNDPFSMQNDVGVVMFQLFAVVEGLESNVDRSALNTAIADAETKLAAGGYTEISAAALEQAIDAAKKVRDEIVSTPEEVAAAKTSLETALSRAVKAVSVTSPGEKPTISAKRSGCGSSLHLVGSWAALIALGGGIVLLRRKARKA